MTQNLVSQWDKCKRGQHIFEYTNYIPHFERKCYVLQFQCEYCELVVFDNIKEAVVNGNTPWTRLNNARTDDKDSGDGKDKDHLPK